MPSALPRPAFEPAQANLTLRRKIFRYGTSFGGYGCLSQVDSTYFGVLFCAFYLVCRASPAGYVRGRNGLCRLPTTEAARPNRSGQVVELELVPASAPSCNGRRAIDSSINLSATEGRVRAACEPRIVRLACLVDELARGKFISHCAEGLRISKKRG
jgi:hypothetical protein